jgi:hypothetical protein
MTNQNKLLCLLALVPLLLVPLVNATVTVTPAVKTVINDAVPGVKSVSSNTYLNKTDGDYHVKGIVRNTIGEARDFHSVTVTTSDLKTNASLAEKIFSVGDILAGVHVSNGGTFPFDVDSGYKAGEVNHLSKIWELLTFG